MAVPDYQAMMLPVLELLQDGQERKNIEIREAVANHFELNNEDRRQMLPGGSQPAYHNRANAVSQRVILIDGQRLANLMIDFNLGVSTAHTIEIKKIDTDYFEG